MKTLTLTLFILLWAAIAMANHPYEGLWEHRKSGQIFEIKNSHDGILIRKDNEDKWHYYQEEKDDWFINEHGDEILFLGKDEVHFKKSGHDRVLYLVKVTTRKQTSYKEWEYIEGIWYDARRHQKYYLKTNREGIQIRKNGITRPQDFYELSHKKHELIFTNPIGDQLIYKNENELIFFPVHATKPRRLVKLKGY
ncbi:MAG: hypothetical protein M3Q56_01025 [Bacteroidota bacterium]|nr:hypothetical protein [Bacteroidota bacterium]